MDKTFLLFISSVGQQGSVDVRVVSTLVREVEELLSHLANEDYHAANQIARSLRCETQGMYSSNDG